MSAKRYLMRGAMNILESHSKIEVAVRDYIGTNSGNLLYAYSVLRLLWNEGVEVDMDHYAVEGNRFSETDIDEINRKYSAYILPLADAFRDDFREKLVRYARFIDKLTIPCYVIGVGLRAPYEPDINEKRSFDEAVKLFVNSVLNKSSLIGVRGMITGSYLEKLGFVEGRHFTVIGCPSMYTYGLNLTQRPLNNLSSDSSIAINYGKHNYALDINRYLYNISNQYPNYIYVAQEIGELRSYVIGTDNSEENYLFPWGIKHKFYMENKVKFYINPEVWYNDLRKVDFSVGSRLHGNVAAILAGVPVLMINMDARMRELANWHNIPSMPMMKFDWDISLESYIEKIDVTSHLRTHANNFNHFIDFLDMNGIEHIYKGNLDRKDAPIDKMIQINNDEIKSYAGCNDEEKKQRETEYINQKSIWDKIK
ncbi:MAG: polysaccharide pyruvyl transferase family protein [Eubacteriales bacterium]|nr:polysaccharide pyruvyl transferase family protein [Eubacteriales bacterium]